MIISREGEVDTKPTLVYKSSIFKLKKNKSKIKVSLCLCVFYFFTLQTSAIKNNKSIFCVCVWGFAIVLLEATYDSCTPGFYNVFISVVFFSTIAFFRSIYSVVCLSVALLCVYVCVCVHLSFTNLRVSWISSNTTITPQKWISMR